MRRRVLKFIFKKYPHQKYMYPSADLNLNLDRELKDESYLKSKYDMSQLRSIGKGGFGQVFLGVRKDGTGTFAIKVIETLSQDELNDALNELMNLSNLRDHPNIMSYESYRQNHVILENKNSLYQIFIELPLATNTLSNILGDKKNLKEKILLNFLNQIFSGLKFAHDKKCVHLDLKPENVLFLGNTCKITDWGGSLRLKSTKSTTIKSKIQTTQGFNAPEIDAETYGAKETLNFYLCDVYSLGILAFRMCGITEQTVRAIPKGKKRYHDLYFDDEIFDVLQKDYSENFLKLLRKMTAYDTKDRVSLQEGIDLLLKIL